MWYDLGVESAMMFVGKFNANRKVKIREKIQYHV